MSKGRRDSKPGAFSVSTLWSAAKDKRLRTNVTIAVSAVFSALTLTVYGAARHYLSIRECHDEYAPDITPALGVLLHPQWPGDYLIPIALLSGMAYCIYRMAEFVAVQMLILALIVYYFVITLDYFLFIAHCGFDAHGYMEEGVEVGLILFFLLTVFLSTTVALVARVRASRRG